MNEIKPQPREYWTKDTLTALAKKLMPRDVLENDMDIFPVKLGVVASRHGWTQPLLAVVYYSAPPSSPDSVVPSISMLQSVAQSRAPVALKVCFDSDTKTREAFYALLNKLNVIHLSTDWTGQRWLDDIREAHLGNVESIYVEEYQTTQKRMPKLCAIDFGNYGYGRPVLEEEAVCRIFRNVPLDSIKHIEAGPMSISGAKAVEQLLAPGGTLSVTYDARVKRVFCAVADIVVNKRVSALVMVSCSFPAIRDSPVLQLENTSLQKLVIYLNVDEDDDGDEDYGRTEDLIEPLVEFARHNHLLTELTLTNGCVGFDNDQIKQRLDDEFARVCRERAG